MRQPCIFRALLHSFTLVLTLQSSSGEAKLGSANSANEGRPVNDPEKELEVRSASGCEEKGGVKKKDKYFCVA